MKVKKRIALLTVLIILFNMFSPYSILFNNTVLAATGNIEEKPVIMNNLGITQKGANRILKIQVAIASEEIINGLDFKFKIDKTKITPCNKNTGVASTSISLVFGQNDYYGGTIQTKTYTSSTGTFRFTMTEPAGGFDIVGNGYVPGEMGDPNFDDAGAGYSGYYPILDLYFKVLDDSLTADNIPLDLFTLEPQTGSVPTGIKIAYKNASGLNVSKDIAELGGKGFKEAEKEINGIAVKTPPSNTTYEHGDNVNLAGGVITITYSDNSTEDISMTDHNVQIKTGSPADVNNQTVTITYKGKETAFPITVQDPVVSLAVKTPMTNVEYNHGIGLDFTGLKLEATKKSGAKIPLEQNSPGVTTSETVASVNSSNFTETTPAGSVPKKGTQKIIFTYEGKTANQTIVVNDTISTIQLTKQPNKKVYKSRRELGFNRCSSYSKLSKWWNIHCKPSRWKCNSISI